MDSKILFDDIKARAFHLYDQFRNLSSDKNLSGRELRFSIDPSTEINAKASVEGSEDIVCLNIGLIEQYSCYFNLSMNEVLKNDLKKRGLDIDDSFDPNQFEILGLDKKGNQISVNDEYINMASFLSIMVNRFVLLHEMGHIYNGHCQYLENKKYGDEKMLSSIFEFNLDNSMSKEKAFDIRTLEMDADAFAATQSIFHLLQIYEGNTFFTLKIPKEDIFYWWGYAIATFIISLKDNKLINGRPEKYTEKMTHLPSTARWILIFGSVDSFLENYDFSRKERGLPIIRKVICKKIIEGYQKAQNHFNELKTPLKQYDIHKEINEEKDEFNRFVKPIQEHWEEIRCELSKFSRLPLYIDEKKQAK